VDDDDDSAEVTIGRVRSTNTFQTSSVV